MEKEDFHSKIVWQLQRIREKRCPRCGSKNTVKSNSRKFCKDCKYYWTKGIRNTYKGKVSCVDCGSINIRKKEKTKTGKRRWLCNECGATWTEGSHIKIRPEERKEWIKWIKEEYQAHGNIKKIKKYIKETIDISDGSINYLIRQAIGTRRKEIPRETIEKAIHYRNLGFEWEDIEKILGFRWKSIYNKAKYKYKMGDLL